MGYNFTPELLLGLHVFYLWNSIEWSCDKDDKYSSENAYVQELLHVWNTKSKNTPKEPIIVKIK